MSNPTDTQILAALNAHRETDWRQSGYLNPFTVSDSLEDWHVENVEKMRSALIAAWNVE